MGNSSSTSRTKLDGGGGGGGGGTRSESRVAGDDLLYPSGGTDGNSGERNGEKEEGGNAV